MEEGGTAKPQYVYLIQDATLGHQFLSPFVVKIVPTRCPSVLRHQVVKTSLELYLSMLKKNVHHVEQTRHHCGEMPKMAHICAMPVGLDGRSTASDASDVGIFQRRKKS